MCFTLFPIRKMVTSRIGVVFGIVLVLSVVCSSFAAEGPYSRAVVESCRGCQLNRLIEVKSFIDNDLPEYENTEFKHIQGAPPELVLYKDNEVIKRIPLAKLNRDECNKLMVENGFTKKSNSVKDEM